jgi:hypothetical protein
MEGAEQRKIAYVFKLKQTANVKKLIERLFGNDEWVDAGQQWQGLSTELRLSGWSKMRRVVVLRRPLRQDGAVSRDIASFPEQICLQFLYNVPKMVL